MSHPNNILDIYRWERFEFGYDGWVLIDELKYWRVLAKWAIDAVLRNSNSDFYEVIGKIKKCNPHLAPDSAVESFQDWVSSGGVRPHDVIMMPDPLNLESIVKFEVYYGYVFSGDLHYDLAKFMKVDVKKIPVINSFWMPNDENCKGVKK